MQLMILRHGQAWPYQNSQSDSQRPLTEEGSKAIISLADAWPCPLPSTVLASPYLRTQQTANILQQKLSLKAVKTSPLLVPETNPNTLLDYLVANSRESDVCLLVSHQPLVSQLLGVLLQGHRRYGLDYPMLPGSLAWLECELPAAGMAQLKMLRHV